MIITCQNVTNSPKTQSAILSDDAHDDIIYTNRVLHQFLFGIYQQRHIHEH